MEALSEALSPTLHILYPDHADLESWLSAQRPRLLRLVALLSGNHDAAEDLAQETLLEAWRHRHKLTAGADADGATKWLNAIARNVCLRWRHTYGRDAAHAIPTVTDDTSPLADLPDTFDIEREIEQEELTSLLDRALAHLPTLSRTILTQRFIDGLPQAEIAAHLGITADAVAQRISRGKLLLRRLLTTDLRDEAATFGIAPAPADGDGEWQSTRIWCPFCGQRYLRYAFNRAEGGVTYACSGDCIYPSGQLCGAGDKALFATLITTLASPKSILTRILLNLNDHYRSVLAHHPAACPNCGRATTTITTPPDDLPPEFIELRGLYQRCPICGSVDGASLWHLAIDRPESQVFWRAHPRIHALPVHEIEAEGRPAYLTGFADTSNTSRVEYVRAQDTLEVLSVHTSA